MTPAEEADGVAVETLPANIQRLVSEDEAGKALVMPVEEQDGEPDLYTLRLEDPETGEGARRRKD